MPVLLGGVVGVSAALVVCWLTEAWAGDLLPYVCFALGGLFVAGLWAVCARSQPPRVITHDIDPEPTWYDDEISTLDRAG